MGYREVENSLSMLVDLTQSETQGTLALCRECFKEITAGLKADADSEDARVTAAAAGLAYYKIMLKRNSESEDFTNFKAGDISVSRSKNDISRQLNNAENYFKQCFAKIVPLCEDNGFAFENVKVKVVL